MKVNCKKCVLDIKNNIPLGLTIKNFILNIYKKFKIDIKQLQEDIKEKKDGFTPVTNQNLKKKTVSFYNIREEIILKY